MKVKQLTKIAFMAASMVCVFQAFSHILYLELITFTIVCFSMNTGYKEAVLYNRIPISLTEVEKLISKEDYTEILSRYVQKPKGKPTLALESDKRPVYQAAVSAEEAFGGCNTFLKEENL